MATRRSNVAGAATSALAGIGGGFAAQKLTTMIPFGTPLIKSAAVALVGIYLSGSKKIKNPMLKSVGSGMTTVAGLSLLQSFGISGSPDVILGDVEISDADLDGGAFATAGSEMGY